MVTTLDVISGGRAILGIGAAWNEDEHAGYGFDFPPIGERMDRLDEALTIAKAMFTEERPSFDGRYYRIDRALNVPRPIQPGGPTILVGGGGEQRTLRIAAKHADMTHWFPLGLEVLKPQERGARAALRGDRPRPVDDRADDGAPVIPVAHESEAATLLERIPPEHAGLARDRHAGARRRASLDLHRSRFHRAHLRQYDAPLDRVDRAGGRGPQAPGVGERIGRGGVAMFVPLSVLEFRDRAASSSATRSASSMASGSSPTASSRERTHRLANALRASVSGPATASRFITLQHPPAPRGLLRRPRGRRGPEPDQHPPGPAGDRLHPRSRRLEGRLLPPRLPAAGRARSGRGSPRRPTFVVLEGEAGGDRRPRVRGPARGRLDRAAAIPRSTRTRCAELFYTSGTTGLPKGVA